jgi:hypothetical protein
VCVFLTLTDIPVCLPLEEIGRVHIWELIRYRRHQTCQLLSCCTVIRQLGPCGIMEILNMSTDSKIVFKKKNIQSPSWLSLNPRWLNKHVQLDLHRWDGILLHLDLVDTQSFSTLTRLLWSFTPPWQSWHGVLLHLDSVDLESYSSLTLLRWSLSPP